MMAAKERTCKQCNVDFVPTRGAKGDHCSLKCWHQSKLKSSFNDFPDFIKCTACHAKIGFGCSVSARLVKRNKKTIVRAWLRLSVKPKLPELKSWRVQSAKRNIAKLTWWGGDDVAKAWMSDYRVKFPDWLIVYRAEIKKNNRNKYRRLFYKKLPKHHPYHLKRICRSRIYKAVKRTCVGDGTIRSYRTIQLIGCSMQNLKMHLESKFKNGMNWNNYGSKWHIDHIIPCAAFDFTKQDEMFKCFHYTNLQPLWVHENLAKSDKIIIKGKILTRGRSINC